MTLGFESILRERWYGLNCIYFFFGKASLVVSETLPPPPSTRYWIIYPRILSDTVTITNNTIPFYIFSVLLFRVHITCVFIVAQGRDGSLSDTRIYSIYTPSWTPVNNTNGVGRWYWWCSTQHSRGLMKIWNEKIRSKSLKYWFGLPILFKTKQNSTIRAPM